MSKTARGAGWMIGWQVTTRLLGLGSTLLLARLLVPADFGLVAIATSLVQAAESLTFLGVEEALVRERKPSRALYDTGFTINIIRNLTLALVLCAGALPAADIFGDARITPLVLALAFGVAFGGCENVGMVDYRRDFAFVMAFRQMIVPRLLSVAVTVTLALWLHSYWALIAGVVTMRVTQVVAGYLLHPYRPRLSLARWRSLIGYSLWAMAQTVAVVLRERTHMLLIGHMLGPRPAGIYALGEDIALMPKNEFLGPLSRVAFSSFAAPEADAADTYRRLVTTAALLTMPMGLGLSLTADAVVRMAFGQGWDAAVPVMRVLGVVGAVMVFSFMGTTLYFAHARMAASFRVTCFGAGTRLVLLLALLPRVGLIGAALAMAASELVESVAYVVLVCRQYGLRGRALLRDTWRTVAATAAMALALWLSGLGWAPLPAAEANGTLLAAAHLAVVVPAGVAVYLAVLLGCWQALGRPPGPEADCLRLARRTIGGLLRLRSASAPRKV